LIILFWCLCTSLFCISSLFLIKFFSIEKSIDRVLIITVLTFVGFFSSCPFVLLSFLGIPVLVLFFVFILVFLIATTKKTIQE
jgi:hypothetical protein